MIKKSDVLIVGTGLAGLFTALNIDENLDVVIISKTDITFSNSSLAQGGIACEYNDNVNLHSSHVIDTLKAGSYLNDEEAVKFLVENAYEAVKKLISFGVEFDIDSDNKFLVTKEGGHSHNRIFHSGGDATGKNVTSALISYLNQKPNITFLGNTMALDVIMENNQVGGLIVLENNSSYYPIYSKKVVLATGGVGSVYGATTNDLNATGDGIGIAYRANAKIDHMEFIQFHPTALYSEKHPSRQRFLVSEAMRGEGAYLVNIENERFMEKYHELKELAPRDIVSQSIYREMYDTWTDHVYLDTRHLNPKNLEKRFPTIFNRCKSEGYILGLDLIPVAPCEHFLCGGITTDLKARTTIKNLYAVGETANTNVHGANRLASNSLLECLVFAQTCAKDITNTIKEDDWIKDFKSQTYPNYNYNYKPIRKKIGDYMDEHVHIVRNTEGLTLAYEVIKDIVKNLQKYPNLTKNYYETLNLATTAYLITKQALERKESIGCHLRIK
ncbi:MAG: L-aspartate oxidase [Candidatus Izemoplasmatales bacterium]|nr:L-aspartate oxidase [Candidatus Izemoplasmatales bacterium]